LSSFKCHYYKTSSGRSPVKNFIDRLSYNTQRKFFAKIEWLEGYGPGLIEPHAKKIDRYIYELRFEGDDGFIRVLYFFYSKNKIILVNGFKKKTKKTPKKEIELANKRREDFLNRKLIQP
jgi:phage-related protein